MPAVGHYFEIPRVDPSQRATRCEPHYLAWRESTTLELEVGNRQFYTWAGVSQHDRYPTDPDLRDEQEQARAAAEGRPPRLTDNWQFSVFGVGTNRHNGRRDPAHWLEIWDRIFGPNRNPDYLRSSIDQVWSLFSDAMHAAGYDMKHSYSAPSAYLETFGISDDHSVGVEAELAHDILI